MESTILHATAPAATLNCQKLLVEKQEEEKKMTKTKFLFILLYVYNEWSSLEG